MLQCQCCFWNLLEWLTPSPRIRRSEKIDYCHRPRWKKAPIHLQAENIWEWQETGPEILKRERSTPRQAFTRKRCRSLNLDTNCHPEARVFCFSTGKKILKRPIDEFRTSNMCTWPWALLLGSLHSGSEKWIRDQQRESYTDIEKKVVKAIL